MKEQTLAARIKFLVELRATSSVASAERLRQQLKSEGDLPKEVLPALDKVTRENQPTNDSCVKIPNQSTSSYSLNLDISFPDSGMLLSSYVLR